MKFLRKIFASKEVKAALGVLDEVSYRFDCPAFGILKKEIEITIQNDSAKLQKIFTEISPHRLIYCMIVNRAGDYLECGSSDYYVYRGLLNPTGEQLLHIFDEAVEEMKRFDYIDEEEAQKQKGDIRKRIEEVG